MPISKCSYGFTKNGEEITKFTLLDDHGRVELINYGATVTSIFVPDKNGEFSDVVLGHSNLSEYEESSVYLGAVCGRVANRVRGGRFSLDGTVYQLSQNVKDCHLHGGFVGFNKKCWDYKVDEEHNRVTFILRSFDGEEGYPGDMDVSVQYSLGGSSKSQSPGVVLQVEYSAICSSPTIVNLTNHSYFNLGGHNSGNISDHHFQFGASFYTPLDDSLVPNGEIRTVENTVFDFRKPRVFSEAFLGNDGNGFDLNYCYGNSGTLKTMAKVVHPSSGRALRVESTQPGMQFYTGNYLIETPGKEDVFYQPQSAFCLETQNYPDAINNTHCFPSPILRPREVYRHETTFIFSV